MATIIHYIEIDRQIKINDVVLKEGDTIKVYVENNVLENGFKAWTTSKLGRYGVLFTEVFNMLKNQLNTQPSWFRVTGETIETLYNLPYSRDLADKIHSFSSKIGVGEISFDGTKHYLYITIPFTL